MTASDEDKKELDGVPALLAENEALRAEVAELQEEVGRLRMAVLWPAPKESDQDALRAIPAVQVGVKPLEWVDRIGNGKCKCEAETVVGLYGIYQDGAWIALRFNGYRISGALPTIEAAKAAAQADYEARIRSELTAQPSPDVAALVEALRKISSRAYDMTWGEDTEVREAMRDMERIADAALARVKGGE